MWHKKLMANEDDQLVKLSLTNLKLMLLVYKLIKIHYTYSQAIQVHFHLISR